MPLTDLAIRNLKPKKRPYKIADGRGLYLLVLPTGGKYWRYKYRLAGGKEQVLALGVYPEVKAGEARDKRDEAKRERKAGRDPAAARKEARRAAAVSPSANTFESVAREWIEKQSWVSSHSEQVVRSFEKYVFPHVGQRPIGDISESELLGMLRKLEARGIHDSTHRVLQRCSAIFRYAILHPDIKADRNPAAGLKGTLTKVTTVHLPSLKEADLPEFLRKLKDYDGRAQTKLALRLQMLSFVRPGELRKAEWTEFNLDKAEWRIPAERMKMKKEHVVPLSAQALEVLEQLQPLTGRGRLLFPSQSRHDMAMSENTILFSLYRMGYHSKATAHGFRSLASTILNEAGWNRDAIERQLAHAEGDKVRAAYNSAEHLPERRKMMQAWADYLDGIAGGAKVVPIGRAA